MQDKKALEDRLKEVQTILETVQNQRNELRQLYKVGPDLAPMPWSCLSLLHALLAAGCSTQPQWRSQRLQPACLHVSRCSLSATQMPGRRVVL